MAIEVEKILTLVAERAQLAEGIEGVRSILLTMYRFPSLKNKKLAQKTGIAIPVIAAVRAELVKSGIIEKRTNLGHKGKNWVKERLNLFYDYDPLPDNIDVTVNKYKIPEELSFLNTCEEFLKKRPSPNYAFDQTHADTSTVLRRTLYLLKKGDIEGRRIIFLGDDDATSILVGLTGMAKEITVIDIDKRVLDFLSELVEEFAIKNINFVHRDLRDTCPKNILNKYDIAVMDPPYTNQGLRLYLKRAKQTLKTSINISNKRHSVIGKKCLLCFGNKPPEEMHKIQLSILDHGFIIRELILDFNHYKGASILGQFSNLFYLQLNEIPYNEDNLSYKSNPIYTSEFKNKQNVPYHPNGFHFVGEMRFIKQKLLQSNDKIQKIFIDSLNFAKLKIHDIYNHNFQPYGYSAVAILKSSHAAIHTWPEHGYISIDIFICDEFSKGLKVIQQLRDKLKPEKSKFFYIERTQGPIMKYKSIQFKD
jgi:S-adenosylmethionine decarboxylase proenzyme